MHEEASDQAAAEAELRKAICVVKGYMVSSTQISKRARETLSASLFELCVLAEQSEQPVEPKLEERRSISPVSTPLEDDLGDEEGAHAGTSAATDRVSDLNALEATTGLGFLTDYVEDGVDELSTFSVEHSAARPSSSPPRPTKVAATSEAKSPIGIASLEGRNIVEIAAARWGNNVAANKGLTKRKRNRFTYIGTSRRIVGKVKVDNVARYRVGQRVAKLGPDALSGYIQNIAPKELGARVGKGTVTISDLQPTTRKYSDGGNGTCDSPDKSSAIKEGENTAILCLPCWTTHTLHPDSRPLFWWQSVIVMLVLETAIEVPFTVCFEGSSLPLALTIVFETIFVVDVGLNFNIGYVDPFTHDTVMDFKAISRRYFRCVCWVGLYAALFFNPCDVCPVLSLPSTWWRPYHRRQLRSFSQIARSSFFAF
jgi:hypothetical protein